MTKQIKLYLKGLAMRGTFADQYQAAWRYGAATTAGIVIVGLPATIFMVGFVTGRVW